MTLDQFSLPDGGTRLSLRSSGTQVVLEVPTSGLPRVVHWGQDLGELGAADLDALVASGPQRALTGLPSNGVPAALLPSPADGWLWTPGITGHREGADFSPAFTVTGVQVLASDRPEIAHHVQVREETSRRAPSRRP